jgi:hypothetical protein
MSIDMVHPVLGGLAVLVSAILLGAPSGVRAYIDLVTFCDKRKAKKATDQPREISTVSPATGTIAKRSA